jgi:hypothetical protein
VLVARTASAQEVQPSPPAPNLTNGEAIGIFGGAMLDCLRTRMAGQMIKDLPAAERTNLKPASAGDRQWVGSTVPAGAPLWTSERLGYLLMIAEPSPERCEVRAVQLPVERTFQAVLFAMGKALPDFKPVDVKPGYDPINYQLEDVDQGQRYVFHLEGAEPGAPGHMLRFSILSGVVVRQPVTDHPAFR